MNRYLIVVDMQVDFITGSLGTEEARAMVPAVVEKIQGFPGAVVVTQDTHGRDYLSTQEGKNLPVEHCVEGTPGHALCPELEALPEIRDATRFCKGTFGSRELAEYLLEQHRREPIDEIELIGLCTDICVVSNALLIKAFLPEIPLSVDSACCAGVTPEKHAAALEAMGSCQIRVYGGN